MRTSNEKIIINQVKFDAVIDNYKEIVDRLVKLYPVSNGDKYARLVNFKCNLTAPKHGWYDYKQGYSKELVGALIEESNLKVGDCVLDPFCGVGTTNLTAQEMGFRSVGLDVNPMAILATRVKTHHFTAEELECIDSIIKNFKPAKHNDNTEYSKAVISAFTPDVLEVLLNIKSFVASIKDEYVQGFFRLALLSIIDVCSLKVKDGNGLKFKKKRPIGLNVLDIYLKQANKMFDELKEANYDVEAVAVWESATNLANVEEVNKQKIALCVFSPPYANCFDYCEVYKLELWLGGYVKSTTDFEAYRNLALRSHVNSKFDHSIRNENSNVNLIADLLSTFNLWNKNIPDMIRGYFDDMRVLLADLKECLADGAKCFIVVANSGYKGILVPTDLLLADIAKDLGYSVNNIFSARKIRSSSQQMHVLNSEYDNLMRESIIEIQK